MKRTILVIAMLSLGVVAYAGSAQGVGTTASQQGQVRYTVGEQCNLFFQFKGFAPGTKGRLELQAQGNTVVLDFQIRSNMWAWQVKVHQLFQGPHEHEAVQFRLAVQGMNHVISNTVTVHCNCGEEGGEGGEGGTGNENGDDGSTGSAGAATAITSQPGFAG